jgi:bifunctional DNase/RNase
VIEVTVAEVTFNSNQGGYAVILREKDAERWLQIFVGTAEAQSIALNLRGGQFQRPMTFDLVAALLRALEGRVRSVQISRLHDGIFYADVLLERPDGELIRLDARPSDSIPLALRLGLPIWVREEVLAAAGQTGFPQMGSLEERILQLEGDLDEAVEREDFEQAVRLRDQIRYYRNLIQPDDEEGIRA